MLTILHTYVHDAVDLIISGGSRGENFIFGFVFRSFRWLLRAFCRSNVFSNFSSRRRDRFGPKIVKFRAILATFWPFEDF